MRLRRIAAFVVLIAIAPALPVWAQQPGSAQGKLTVNGQAATLSHAYARIFKNNPQDTDKYVEVLLTAEPVDPLLAGSSSSLRKLAGEKKLTGIQVTLNAEHEPFAVTLFHPALSDGSMPAMDSRRFEAQTFDEQNVAGRLFTPEEGSFGDDRYEFDVSFRAAIAPDPFTIGAADRAALAALAPGAASGSFVVNGQETRFRYGYAVGRRDFPGDPEKLVLVLSDAPIPDQVLLEGFGLQKLGREGTVHAVEVQLGADHQPEGGQLYHQIFSKDEAEGTAMSVSVAGMHNFVPDVVDANIVSGKLFMKAPEEFMGVTYYYAGMFRATVLRKPPPTYEGEKAAQSGPGKVAAAFFRAARAGDKATLKKLVAPEMAAQLDGPQGADMMKMMAAFFSSSLRVAAVTESGDTAEVVAVAGGKESRESTTLTLTRINGEWKVSQR